MARGKKGGKGRSKKKSAKSSSGKNLPGKKGYKPTQSQKNRYYARTKAAYHRLKPLAKKYGFE